MTSSASDVLAERVEAVADALVAGGRVVPGIELSDNGRARSWWWPAPAARDRAALAALATDGSVESQLALAAALASAVDRGVRRRIEGRDGLGPPRRRGRAGPAEAWLRALVLQDPWLPTTVRGPALRTLADQVTDWVRAGTPELGQARLCLRVNEPPPDAAPDAVTWTVELLLQDVEDLSLVVAADAIWAGTSPFGPTAVQTLLAGLARAARIAPELAPALDQSEPRTVELTTEELMVLARDRALSLVDAGFGVLLPHWWGRRRRPGLRANATSRNASGASGGVGGGVGLDQVVSFQWEAALGEVALSDADLATLAQAAASKQPLVRLRGEWVEVRPDEIAALVARAGRTQQASAGELLRAGLGVGDGVGLDLPQEVAIEGVSATGWLGRLLDEAVHGSIAPVADLEDFVGELRPYQARGVGWLAFLGRLGLGACLADDMGLGKTAQLIASMFADPAAGPALVVCPVSVLGNWQRELERFAPSLAVMVHHGPGRFGADDAPFAERAAAHDVVLTTYSLVGRDRDALAEVAWSRLVLDEAQQVKNPGTAQARAVRAIPAARRVALTGTPVENRLSELWSIMQILNPGLLGSARAFRDRFGSPIERDGDEEAAALLRRVTGPFVLRRLKTDRNVIDDLPDKIEVIERCVLTREQATLYQAVVDDLLAKSAEAEEGAEQGSKRGGTPNTIARRGLVLAGLLRLKQVCNHPAHFLGDGSDLAGRSGKLNRIEELLEEILDSGDKVLCFTQFAEWGSALRPYLARRFDQEVLWLHGGVRRAKRDEQVARFQEAGGPRLLLVSLKAGGTGLNLTAASHVIHLDRWWNPAVEDQATDRAYRIGQQRTVVVHKPVCQGTVEERIDAMITAKRALAGMAVGTGEAQLSELSTDELREVISLGADAVRD